MLAGRPLRASAYLALVLTQLWLTGCQRTPLEQAVAESVHRLAAGVENRDAGEVMDVLHDNFSSSGAGGVGSRRQARRLLMAVFYRHQNISVTLTNVQVTADAMRRDRATATFNALVTGGRGGLLPETAQLYRVSSEWILDDEWQLLSLQAKRALEP